MMFSHASAIIAAVLAVDSGPVELWPQPNFSSDEGLTIQNSLVTAGEWVVSAPGTVARAVADVVPITLTAGMTFHYYCNVTASDLGTSGETLRLQVGDITVTIKSTDGAEVVEGDIGPLVAPTQLCRIFQPLGDANTSVDQLSITGPN